MDFVVVLAYRAAEMTHFAEDDPEKPHSTCNPPSGHIVDDHLAPDGSSLYSTKLVLAAPYGLRDPSLLHVCSPSLSAPARFLRALTSTHEPIATVAADQCPASLKRTQNTMRGKCVSYVHDHGGFSSSVYWR